MAEPTHDLDYFMRLVLKGKQPGCSSGERAAKELAATVVQFLPRLDGRATRGFVELVEVTRRSPVAASDLVDRAS